MHEYGSNPDSGRGSWSEILDRCGPGIDDDEPSVAAQGNGDRPRNGDPRAKRRRPAVLRYVSLLALTAAAALAPDLIAPQVPPQEAGERANLHAGSVSGAASAPPVIDRQPSHFRPAAASADLTWFNTIQPGSAAPQAIQTGSVVSDPAVPVGGPFVPAGPAIDTGPAAGSGGSLQARLERPQTRADTDAQGPKDAAAVQEAAFPPEDLPLRQRFDDAEALTPAPPSAELSAGDAAILINRGKDAMGRGELVAARLIFQKVMDAGYADGAYNLARSYDPKVLAGLPVRMSNAAEDKAKMLYALAENTQRKIGN